MAVNQINTLKDIRTSEYNFSELYDEPNLAFRQIVEIGLWAPPNTPMTQRLHKKKSELWTYLSDSSSHINFYAIFHT